MEELQIWKGFFQRDDMNMLNDDFIALRFDTFRDARNNIVLGVNALGSQLDARQINEISEDMFIIDIYNYKL